MGHLASKVKGDSPRLPSCDDTWSKAPYGSWIIRFSPSGPFTQKLNKVAEIKGLPLYHWPSPDWVTGDAFNTLMFVVVQIFLEGNHNRLMKLMEEPLEAAEMIAQFNTFITSTNQDVKELQNQLFEAAHESIYLDVEDDQLRYLDLLITNAFDPQYQLRAVLSRKSRSSKSSLLHSVSSKVKSKLAHLKNKGCWRSRRTPAQPFIPVSSNAPPLRPTAPGLSEFTERTETVTFNDGVDNTNEIPVVVIADNSNINGTKDEEGERYEAESRNDESTRKSEEKSVNLESNLSDSLSLPLTSDTVVPTSEVEFLEQSPDELIAKQKSVCCTKASSDTNNSFTVVVENEPFLPPKENNENGKNAGYSSCLQEDVSKDADIHVLHAEVEEPDNSNSGQFYGNVPSGIIFTVDSAVEYDEEDGPVCCDEDGSVCCNVSAGAKYADSSEYSKYNDPPCTDVPSGSRYVHSSDDNNMFNGQACIDSPSDFKQAELDEHSEDNGPLCTDISPGSKHAYSFEPCIDPACTDVPSGSRYDGSSEHNDIGPLTNVDNGPTSSSVSSGLKYAEPSEHNKGDGPACSDIPPGSEQVDSHENSHNNAQANAESPPGTIHEESSLEEERNGPVHEEISPDTKQQHNSKVTINVMVASEEKQLSNQCTFLPIYGLSKHCLKSTAPQVSTAAQGLLSNVKEVKEQSDEPQMHQPSSSSFACFPFHGLSRGSFCTPMQGASTGVQTRKREADIDEVNGIQPVAKRLKEDMCEQGGKSYPCHSSSEGIDSLNDTELNPTCSTADDTERGGDDSSSSESVEWHDALEDI